MENNFIPLESILIATPCRADWDQMTGDAQARFCGSCAKNVYDFSAMTRAQAQQLLLEKEGHLCVKLHRRADGTVITSDCPVGVSPVKRSAGVVRTLMATAMAAVLAIFGVRGAQADDARMGDVAVVPSHTLGEPLPHTMGKPAMPPKVGTPPMTHTMGIVAPPRAKPTPKPVPKKVKPTHSKKNVVKKNGHR